MTPISVVVVVVFTTHSVDSSAVEEVLGICNYTRYMRARQMIASDDLPQTFVILAGLPVTEPSLF